MVTTFHLLGDAGARIDDLRIDVGHARQRCVLVALLIDMGQVVSAERLTDRVWGDQAPQRSRSVLHSYLSRLRQAFRGAEDVAIHRQPTGYVLTAAASAIDLRRFQDLVKRARGAPDEQALPLFEQAMDLWRGEPFPRLDTPWLNQLREMLQQQMLAARLDHLDVALRAGQHGRLLPTLRSLVETYPLDERLTGQLMLALYRSGQQAEALDQYQRVGRLLADDLGVDPNPDLRQLHLRILNADPALAGSEDAPVTVAHPRTGPTPRQLPLDIATFVGRETELTGLGNLLQADDFIGSGPVVVIHGPAGVGKSALAVRAASLWSSAFPDGQLYLNLRGATLGVEPLTSADALGRFLRALGVSAADVPRDVEESAALFRTVVADRRMLILLDNAATPAQLRPLLPGSGGNAVLVTTRTNMAILDGATHLHLGPLSSDVARTMLDRLVGDDRTATDRNATRRLAELCDHLPLGLHLAAARLRARPSWNVAHLVGRLADEQRRLGELAAGDVAVRSSLRVSHAALENGTHPGDRAAAHALSALGLLRMASIDVNLAAALFDTAPPAADRIIQRLVDVHLIEESEPGRYHLHDLVRLFAHELAAELFSADETAAALGRVLGFYLATARQANGLVYPRRAHYPVPAIAAESVRFSGRDDAYGWLEAERTNMVAIIRQVLSGQDDQARLGVGLTLALHWFFVFEGYRREQSVLAEEALGTAVRIGDRAAEAYVRGSLAGALMDTGRQDDAITQVTAELSICREIGDRFGEQRALGNLAHIHLSLRRPEAAIPLVKRQYEVAEEIGAEIGMAYALSGLGKAYHQLGRSEEAVGLFQRSLAWHERMDDDLSRYGALTELGQLYIDIGQSDEAVPVLTRSLECARRSGYRMGEVWALARLARAARSLGLPAKALRHAEAAIAISGTLTITRARSAALAERAAARSAEAAGVIG